MSYKEKQRLLTATYADLVQDSDGIVSEKRDLTNVFSRFLKCPLQIALYALRIKVSVMEL